MNTNIRKYIRKPFARPIKYSLHVMDLNVLKRVHHFGVSSDICSEGLCLITSYPLEQGHVIIFEDEIKTDDVTATFAVVKWVTRIDANKYRAGMQFA